MKRLTLLVSSLLLLGVTLLPMAATAQVDIVPNETCAQARATAREGNPVACTEDRPNENPLYGPDGIIVKIANLLAFATGIAAVIVIIVAGIQYMVSTGDATKINNAKNAIIYAVVGLVVIVAARTIVVFMISKLG